MTKQDVPRTPGPLHSRESRPQLTRERLRVKLSAARHYKGVLVNASRKGVPSEDQGSDRCRRTGEKPGGRARALDSTAGNAGTPARRPRALSRGCRGKDAGLGKRQDPPETSSEQGLGRTGAVPGPQQCLSPRSDRWEAPWEGRMTPNHTPWAPPRPSQSWESPTTEAQPPQTGEGSGEAPRWSQVTPDHKQAPVARSQLPTQSQRTGGHGGHCTRGRMAEPSPEQMENADFQVQEGWRSETGRARGGKLLEDHLRSRGFPSGPRGRRFRARETATPPPRAGARAAGIGVQGAGLLGTGCWGGAEADSGVLRPASGVGPRGGDQWQACQLEGGEEGPSP